MVTIALATVAILSVILLGAMLATTHGYRRRLADIGQNDLLTSLGSHHAFYDDFAREFSRAHRRGHHLTLALIDIDDFKTVNDLQGHQHGDNILKEIARALRSGRTEDRVYRIGGDEFAMLFAETSEREAKIALVRLQDAIHRCVSGVTLSMGLCELAADHEQQDLYKRAEAALFAAKRSGRNTITQFSDIENTARIFPSRKSAALIQLLKEEALDIAFQPIWKRDGTAILGFEALARPDAALGLLGPQEAFDIAERMREVPELDSLCLRKAFAVSDRVPGNGLLFVNVSPETLSRAEFQPELWVAMIHDAGIDPGRLVIEVTERRITDTAELVAHAAELQRLGIRIALDDAGSGYAGLEILGKLPLDFVKIDRTVIVHAMTEPGARGVLAGIVAIARETNTHVIAEGIENMEQFDFVRSLPPDVLAGIGSVQGFLFGRPQTGPIEIGELSRYARIFELS